MVGKALGHYEILEPLGKGGMGEVYRARDTNLDRDVAIKVLPEDFAEDTERLARFEREAKLLASLNHSNIATIHGLEESDGVRFIAMELVEGDTLADRLATQGRIDVEEALEIAHQIAEALEAAHESGVIHRDLKPANIKITPDEKVKVLDFGLAKAFEADGSPSEISPDLSHSPTMAAATRTGVIMGTAAYMSPEQARGKAVDKRSDIWAFGCVLYEMLSGGQAFSGATVSDTMAAILKEEPDWSALPARTSEAIRRLLARSLEKDPYERLRDVGDARWELNVALHKGQAPFATSTEEGGVDKSSPTTILARGLPWLALGLASGTLLAFAIWGRAGETQSIPTTHLPIDTEGDIIIGEEFQSPMIALSPDGRKLAYVGGFAGSRRLYVIDLDVRGDARVIRGGEGASSPFFSPDGETIGFVAEGKLKRVSLSGGAPRELADTSLARGAVWSPDGSTIYYVPKLMSGVWKVPADGDGAPEQVTTPDADGKDGGHWWPDITPDGNRLLYLSCCSRNRIFAVDLVTGDRTLLIENGFFPRYSPTGHLLFAEGSLLLAAPFDPETLAVGGAVEIQNVVTAHEMHAGFALSQSGTLAYLTGVPELERPLVKIDRMGRAETLTEPRGFSHPLEFNRDGTLVALTLYEGQQDIYLFNPARGDFDLLTTDPHNDFHPNWTSDSQRIVFTSGRTGGYDLYIIPANRSAPAELLHTSDYFKWSASFAPDDSVLAFVEERIETGFDILMYSMDQDRASPFLVNRWDELNPRFSPDGRWIVYQSDELGEYNIYAIPYPGREQVCKVSTSGGTDPRWSADGSEVVYLRGSTAIAVDVSGLESCPNFEERPLFDGLDPIWGMSPAGDVFMTPAVIDPLRLHLVQNWFEELRGVMATAR